MIIKNINIWYISSLLISIIVAIPILTVFSSFFETTGNYSTILKDTFLYDYIFNSIILLLGVLALTFYGYDYAALAWKIKETSWSSPAQIQIYMVKAMIPAAGVTLTIQGISEVFRSIICIQTGHWPARMVVAEETEKILMRTSQDEDQKDVI